MTSDHPDATEIEAIAEDAYQFFLPMLMGYRFAWATFIEDSLPSFRVPLNVLGGEAVTLTPDFRDVISPNSDTPYSMAGLDLRAEPLVLVVPAVTDRYYVLQLEDLWGCNAHYVGTRATGTGAGTYLLAGPGWSGDAPEDITEVLRFETDLVLLLGRTQLHGPDDLDALATVMASYRLEPLSSHVGTAPPHGDDIDWPAWDDPASRDDRFIGLVNRLLPLCQPPHPDDVALLDRFAAIGIGPDRPPLDDETSRDAIRAGVDAARRSLAERAGSSGVDEATGWGTLAPFGDRRSFAGDFRLRALGAMVGWGGNDRDEAFYPICRQDADGAPLDGHRDYELTLPPNPPVEAFWSVTMYDTSYDGTAGYLVDNPIDRWVINDSTEGTARAEDGSLTIHLSSQEPSDPTARANWLPAPDGPFYVVLRLYMPTEAAFDGSWPLPPVVRTD